MTKLQKNIRDNFMINSLGQPIISSIKMLYKKRTTEGIIKLQMHLHQMLHWHMSQMKNVEEMNNI